MLGRTFCQINSEIHILFTWINILHLIWFLLQLCFAYKGPFSSSVNFLIYYTNTDKKLTYAGRNYKFSRSSNLKIWNYACMDVYKSIIEDSYFKTRTAPNPSYKVAYIRAIKDGSSAVDMFVDDLYIGGSDLSGKFFLLFYFSLFLFFSLSFQ